jgi:hypothetical protein
MTKIEIGSLLLVALLSPLNNLNIKNTVISKTQCISENFDTFYPKYISDIDIQKKYTIFPLYISTNNKENEFSQRTFITNEEDVQFPIIPKTSTSEHKATIFLKREISSNKLSIKISYEKDKISATYHFIKNDCWNLYMIEYEAL